MLADQGRLSTLSMLVRGKIKTYFAWSDRIEKPEDVRVLTVDQIL